MNTPELFLIGSHSKPRFYLCFGEKVFRVITQDILNLYLEYLPLFNPTEDYPRVAEIGNSTLNVWSTFGSTPRSKLPMSSKKPLIIPDCLIRKWSSALAGSTGAVDLTNSQDNV